jgi:small multidrug resistance pump
MSVLFLAAAILLEITGTTALKLSDGFTRMGPAAVVVVCYISSFVVLSWALRGIALSTAYAIWSGIGTALVATIGILWFGEPAGAWKLLSIGLIIAGVVGLHLAGTGS